MGREPPRPHNPNVISRRARPLQAPALVKEGAGASSSASIAHGCDGDLSPPRLRVLTDIPRYGPYRDVDGHDDTRRSRAPRRLRHQSGPFLRRGWRAAAVTHAW